MSKLIKVPTLKSGEDSATAKYLSEVYAEAQHGLRKVVAAGLCCFTIKEQLPHGKFQPWLDAHCPEVSYRSLAAYMQLTKKTLEVCGFKTLKAYFKSAEPLHFCRGGDLLLLPEGKLPEGAMPLREKICAVIDGKTQSQLFLEFKQTEDDGEDAKPKRGRLKGHGGATKQQRAAAAEAERKAQIAADELDAKDFCKWIDRVCQANRLPLIGDKVWQTLHERQKELGDFMRRVGASRKGGAQ